MTDILKFPIKSKTRMVQKMHLQPMKFLTFLTSIFKAMTILMDPAQEILSVYFIQEG